MSNTPQMYDLPDDDFEDFLKGAETKALETGGKTYDDVRDLDSFQRHATTEADLSFNDFYKSIDKPSSTGKEISVNDINVVSSKQDKVKTNYEALANKVLAQDYKQEIPDASVALAFEFIKEQGLLHIPDNVELTAANLKDVINHDQELRNQAALNYVMSKAGDPYVAELYNIVWNGGTLDDLQNANGIVQDQKFFSELDLTDEGNQRQVISMFYKEGLDENIPSHVYFIQDIPNRVDNIIGSYRGEEEAVKAVNYFLDGIEKEKELLEDAKHQRIAEQNRIEIAKLQYEEKWRTEFFKTLVEREWTTDKKNEITSQFDNLKLDDGSTISRHQYKLKKIFENPKNTQILMRFLTDYDEYKEEFKSLNKSVEAVATSRILDLIKSKGNTSISTSSEEVTKDSVIKSKFDNYLDRKTRQTT